MLLRHLKMFLIFILLCGFGLQASSDASHSLKTEKMYVVLALPYQEGVPLDPVSWYTEEYVDYIASLLPEEEYEVKGYFVCFQNIPKFLDDMKALYDQKKKLVVLNFCDGGEWDGYPCLTLLRKWEKHAVKGLVSMTGANYEFIVNSDDKNRMNEFLKQAKLKFLPQVLLSSKEIAETDLSEIVKVECLDQYWPLFCKLNIGAGALGIGPESICQNIEELNAQVNKMHAQFPISDILIQPYLPGPEYTVLVLNDYVYASVRRDFHNPHNVMLDSYLHGDAKHEDEITYLPAPENVKELALKAIQAIPGRHHYTRLDLREDGKGNVYVIDINDRPGIGNLSTMHYMLEYNHLTISQLLIDVLNSSSQ